MVKAAWSLVVEELHASPPITDLTCRVTPLAIWRLGGAAGRPTLTKVDPQRVIPRIRYGTSPRGGLMNLAKRSAALPNTAKRVDPT